MHRDLEHQLRSESAVPLTLEDELTRTPAKRPKMTAVPLPFGTVATRAPSERIRQAASTRSPSLGDTASMTTPIKRPTTGGLTAIAPSPANRPPPRLPATPKPLLPGYPSLTSPITGTLAQALEGAKLSPIHGSAGGLMRGNGFLTRRVSDQDSSVGVVTANVTDRAPVLPLRERLPTMEKGLRQFSALVCSKVEEKGLTTYNEVADELVQEIGAESSTGERFDHKNIRRRVYDALNVLMAIDIIAKDKKEIRWLGLPNDLAQDLKHLQSDRAALERRTAEKRKNLTDLLRRLIALKSLISRNRKAAKYHGHSIKAASSTTALSNASSSAILLKGQHEKLQLPFILINAPKDCRVHCEMLEDRTQYLFQFDSPFFINEDVEILRLMGLDQAAPEELRSWLSPDLLGLWLEGAMPAASAARCGPILRALAAPITNKRSSNKKAAPNPPTVTFHDLMNPPVKRNNNHATNVNMANGSTMSDLGFVPTADRKGAMFGGAAIATHPLAAAAAFSATSPQTMFSRSYSLTDTVDDGTTHEAPSNKRGNSLALFSTLGSSPIL